MILHQPSKGCLGDKFIEELESDSYTHLSIIVAYAKISGVSRLEEALKYFVDNGGYIELIVGIDQKNTSYEALEALFEISNSLTIVHNENLSHTFHHKVYLLEDYNREEESFNSAWLAVGSNNLTAGGLFINYESCFIDELDPEYKDDCNMYNDTIEIFDNYSDSRCKISYKIKGLSDINDLYKAGYILKEKESRKNIFKAKSRNSTSDPIFGRETFKAPSVKKSDIILEVETGETSVDEINDSYIPNNTIEEMYWFEMRRSTGGSRNILDLSMTGTIVSTNDSMNYPEGSHISGGVTFFDIDPEDDHIEKDITISYLGNDYYPSTIKFAQNNGSWRVQLKGSSSTDSWALSQHGSNQEFVNKILIFQKLSTDYYILEVIDESELFELERDSVFSAVNGSNLRSKKFGKLK